MSNTSTYDQILLSGQLISATGNNIYINGLLSVPKPIGWTTDGAGSVISSGIKGYIASPYTGTIISWNLIASQTGYIGLDIYKANVSATSLPTTSIIGGINGPVLVNAAMATGTTVGWTTTSVAINDIFGWVVTGSPSLITRFTLTLNIT